MIGIMVVIELLVACYVAGVSNIVEAGGGGVTCVVRTFSPPPPPPLIASDLNNKIH